MVTAFLIATLVIFSINLILALLTLGIYMASEDERFPIIQVINIAVCLGMITWNIFALVSY